MNIKIASDILNIKFPCTKNELRKSYLNSALEFHPDKNKNLDSTLIFQNITNAYDYLNDLLDEENKNYHNLKDNDEKNQDNKLYYDLIEKFINSSLQKTNFISKNDIEKLVDLFKNNFKELSLKVLEDLSQETLIGLWDYIHYFKSILNLSKETIQKIEEIIKNKLKNNSIIILNPTLLNIINNDYYKLFHKDEKFLVPLWKTYSSFQTNTKNYLYIKCIPNLSREIKIIKENNSYNLYVTIYKNINEILKNNIDIQLANINLTIPGKELKIQKQQNYVFKKKGIKDFDENLNVISIGDIIININLF